MIYLKNGIFCSMLFFFFCGFVGCQDEDEEGKNTVVSKPAVYYLVYSSSLSFPLQANDTISLKLGDTIDIYTKAEEDLKVFSEENSTISLSSNVDAKRYSISTKQIGFNTAGLFTNIISYLFYIDVKSVGWDFYIMSNPDFLVDTDNEILKRTILSDLESYSNCIRIADKFELTYVRDNCGTVEYTNKAFDADTIIGTFRDDGISLILSLDNQTEYNFTFEEEKTSISTHRLYLNLTNTFRVKYPAEQISNVSVTALCEKTEKR